MSMIPAIKKDFLSKFFFYFSQSTLAFKMRLRGRVIASIYDLFSVVLAWTLVNGILVDAMKGVVSISFTTIGLDLFWILPIQFLLFRYFGLYRGFWRFASIQDLRKLVFVSILGGLVIFFILFVTEIANNSRVLPSYSVTILYTLFLIIFLSAARFFVRFAKDYKHQYKDCQRVIIVGAGNAGEGLARDLLRDVSHTYKPVAFVDDDLLKRGREIHNIRVVGIIAELPKLITQYEIDLVLIAIPSASSASMRSVVNMCEKANIRCYTLPGIKDLANGHVSINVLRRISLEDLLGRYPVPCQWASIKTHLQNKTILITGGGGSIGSELCRQIVSLGNITQLIIVDNNEYNLYSIDMELRQKYPSYVFHSVLLSITDQIGIQALLKKYRPELIFHAAAYKHVPLLENQLRVAIFNNIIGTSILAQEALKSGVETFVLISSDKAVNPTNIMGATKRAAEYFCQNLNDTYQKTKFITVRFGNVLDSAGSVIPLFRKQIESGGPITVTHPEITRFFMTIPEASQLILQAAFLGEGGEIFVLDMGDPIKIRYLAEQMIKLSGKHVDQDIQIIYTGLRPGEKLYEECFYSNETLQPTSNAKILRARSSQREFSEIQMICEQLAAACHIIEIEYDKMMALLKKLVPEYQVNIPDNTLNHSHKTNSFFISPNFTFSVE